MTILVTSILSNDIIGIRKDNDTFIIEDIVAYWKVTHFSENDNRAKEYLLLLCRAKEINQMPKRRCHRD